MDWTIDELLSAEELITEMFSNWKGWGSSIDLQHVELRCRVAFPKYCYSSVSELDLRNKCEHRIVSYVYNSLQTLARTYKVC